MPRHTKGVTYQVSRFPFVAKANPFLSTPFCYALIIALPPRSSTSTASWSAWSKPPSTSLVELVEQPLPALVEYHFHHPGRAPRRRAGRPGRSHPPPAWSSWSSNHFPPWSKHPSTTQVEHLDGELVITPQGALPPGRLLRRRAARRSRLAGPARRRRPLPRLSRAEHASPAHSRRRSAPLSV